MLKGTQTYLNNYLIKQLPSSTVFIDRKLEVVHASDLWINYFEFNKEHVTGKKLHELFETVTGKWKSNLQDCLAGDCNKTGTEMFVDNSGNERWFEWSSTSWHDEKENVIGIILQTQDVTDRLQYEMEHEKLELLLKEKSEIAKIGSWEYNAVNDELYWCDMTKKIHEVPADFVPNINEAINYYKEGYSRNTVSMAVYHAMEKGTSWSEKLQLITAKGNEVWVIAAGKPLFSKGKYVGLIGTFQDITDHVLSEIKTKESENLLRTVVDSLPLNVYIKDLESRKILVNKSECEYLGVDNPQHLLGKSDFDLYDKEIAQISRDEDLSVINSLNPILGRETINVKKDGTATTFLTSKIPLKDEDDKASGILGISLDITNLKQKEEELRDLINVTSLQNKKLINFAHIVSHNLRSHTANFSMLLDFLRTETDEEEKNNIIGMLTDASDNLLETLENLNEVVAISTNVNLEKKSVNLYDKISAAEKNLAAFLKNANATLINDVSRPAKVKVIPAYIDSILMNFITNAVKYKDPNRDPIIKLSLGRNEKYTILSIEDNGLGIDLKKYGDKLFGMYKTFHNNCDARGIGLYITKNQIEAMNGKVMACSEVGKGTTFNIYFNEEN